MTKENLEAGSVEKGRSAFHAVELRVSTRCAHYFLSLEDFDTPLPATKVDKHGLPLSPQPSDDPEDPRALTWSIASLLSLMRSKHHFRCSKLATGLSSAHHTSCSPPAFVLLIANVSGLAEFCFGTSEPSG